MRSHAGCRLHRRFLLILTLALAAFVAPRGHGAPATPPTLSEDPGNLETTWAFRIDPEAVGENEGWHTPDYDDADWQPIRVPGYWEPQGVTTPRPGKPPKPKNGVPWTDYDGVAWYRIRVTVPAEWEGQPLVLRLGSVDDMDRTYVNGRAVGATDANTPRAVGVQRLYEVPADAVRAGAANLIAVRVEDGGGPGGLMGPLVTLLPKRTLEEPIAMPDANRSLAERFANPPAAARILKIVHGLPDGASDRNLLLRGLASRGFGGIVANVSFDSYLQSEEKWAAFADGVSTAKAAGMALWLYDEKGYPSGTAGGLTLRGHPEWEARGLLIAQARTTGGPVELAVPPGTPVAVTAYPVTAEGVTPESGIDVARHVTDGVLRWNAPEGGNYLLLAVSESMLYEGTHAEISLADKLPYTNLLMAEPTARFLELTHQAYAERLGTDLGAVFDATFTDEPSLMSRFFRTMPYAVLPWSPDLPEEFRRRRGYDLLPKLAALVADGPGAPRTRYDFRNTVGELVAENFFGQIRDWCRDHGIPSGGHLLVEESLVDHVAFYGDFFRCMRALDAPSIDCLTSIPSQVPRRIARLAASAADLGGHELVMCETSDHVQRYRPPGDDRPAVTVTEEQIRGTVNRLVAGGINTVTSYYTFAGLDSAQVRRLNEWTGRCTTALRGGRQVTDVALLYPAHSVWPRFLPARSGATASAEAREVETVFNLATDSLFRACRDFTVVDAPTLAEATYADGAMQARGMAWRVLVLPYADTLPMEAWEAVGRFHDAGGTVIALRALPANSDTEFPSPKVARLANRIFGPGDEPRVAAGADGGVGIFLPAGTESLLPEVLNAVVDPDVRIDDPQQPLQATRRRIDGHDVFFVINDGPKPVRANLRVSAAGPGELLDPATGTVTPLPDPSCSVTLDAYGAVLLRYADGRQPERHTPPPGPLPGLATADLEVGEPAMHHGEFVRGTLRRTDAGWAAEAVLTKGDVDTFLFVALDRPEGYDLEHATGLFFETRVPPGQQASAELLVLVDERDGGTFLAATGRPLGAGGTIRTFIPLSAFSVAGWSKDPDGVLDPARIVSVKIGWGGYYGREGEEVTFEFAPPKALLRAP